MKKLLLADDSPTIERMIRLNFEGEDIEILCARDGDRALSLFEKEKPDIVLADIYMPGQNGFNVCNFIKNHKRIKPVPVLLLVGSFEPFNDEEAERVRADGVLVKPLDSNQLVETVKKLLQKDTVESMREKTMEDKPDDIIELIDMDDLDLPEGVTISPTYTKEDSMTASMQPAADSQPSPSARELSLATDNPNILDIDPLSFVHTQQEITPTPELLLELPAWKFTKELLPSTEIGRPADEVVPATIIEREEIFAPTEENACAPAPISEEREEPIPVQAVPDTLAAVAEEPPPTVPSSAACQLSDEDIDRIAQRVVSRLSDRVLREIAWEIIPDLATIILKEEAYKRPELLH